MSAVASSGATSVGLRAMSSNVSPGDTNTPTARARNPLRARAGTASVAASPMLPPPAAPRVPPGSRPPPDVYYGGGGKSCARAGGSAEQRGEAPGDLLESEPCRLAEGVRRVAVDVDLAEHVPELR